MISRTEAERIAGTIHQLRPDWPAASIVTLIVRDLTHWAYLDLVVGLAHVAAEQNLGGQPVSNTPARVKEEGPWRNVGITNADERDRVERDLRARAERREQHQLRMQDIDACDLCDSDGYLPNGNVCRHDPEAKAKAERGRQLVEAARLAVLALKQLEPTPDLEEATR